MIRPQSVTKLVNPAVDFLFSDVRIGVEVDMNKCLNLKSNNTIWLFATLSIIIAHGWVKTSCLNGASYQSLIGKIFARNSQVNISLFPSV